MSYETPAAHFIWNPLGSFDCTLKTASIFGARCALHGALDRATMKENEDGGRKEVCNRCTGERAGQLVREILNLNCERSSVNFGKYHAILANIMPWTVVR